MSLAPGTRLGAYEIIAPLGAGGMGEVYRARDTNLGRNVAIKILPASMADDADRLARFEREAQTLASLNHQHIAQIFGVERVASEVGPGLGRALVMELVEGEDLSQRLTRGALPLDEALAIARQIADALESAHESGIVHRDLKPANIKVRSDGTVKVLDFGLAKAVEQSPAGSSGPSLATLTSPAMMTQAGMILGTAAYMAPEQAKGRPVDRRADIWAFGVVLFEMLTGRGAFHAEDVSETLAAVLTRPIDLTALPASVPARVRTLIHECLVRDPKQRLRDIGDARRTIEQVIAGAPGDPMPTVAPRPEGPGWRRAAPWAIATLAVIVAIAAIAWRPASPPTLPRLVTRAEVPLKDLAGFVNLSRDGTHLVYTSAGGPKGFYIAHRRLDQLESQPVAGTEDGRMPLLSPDGQSVAFMVSTGKLRRAALAGGGSVALCDGYFNNGADWGDDDTIVFAGDKGLLRVPASGGVPQPLTTVDPAKGERERGHVRPQFLPGGRLLFTILPAAADGEAQFAMLDLGTGAYRPFARSGDNGRFVPSGVALGLGRGVGHLLHGRQGTLFAMPFDLDRMTALGPEVPVVDRVSSVGPLGTADYSVSDAGLLIYSQASGATSSSWAWADRSGARQPLNAQATFGTEARLSPDATRLVGAIQDGERNDLWVLDVRRGTPTRLTFNGASVAPIWSADGLRIIHGATVEGETGIYSVVADGGGRPELLFATERAASPTSISADGRTLLYNSSGRIYVRSLEPGVTGAGRPLHESVVGREGQAQLSPDGRMVAYVSTESGTPEAYLHPFPGPGRRERVSSSGAQYVRWSSNGKELVYWNTASTGNFAITSVAVDVAPSLQLAQPRDLFMVTDANMVDVVRDGSRFLLTTFLGNVVTRFVTVTDWFEELRRRAPAKP